MLTRFRAWRTRTKVLVGVPAGFFLLLVLFFAVRGAQYASAGSRDLATLLPPGAHLTVRLKGLPAAWPKLRTSPLMTLLLGRPPQGDAVHDLAAHFAGKDPLPAALTEDRAVALCVSDAVAAVYDLDDPAKDVVVAIELPFVYYAPLPFAGLALDGVDAGGHSAWGYGGSFAMASIGRTLIVATRPERLGEVLSAKGGSAANAPSGGGLTTPAAPGAGMAVSARLDLAALPKGSRFRADLDALFESVPYRELFHALNVRTLQSVGAAVSTDGTTIAIDADGAMERRSLDRRLASLYAQPPLPSALLDRLPMGAAALSAFRLDAEREWGYLRGLVDEPDRRNRGAEMGEALKFVYANVGPMLDDFEKRGFAKRLFPLVGDAAAVIAARGKSEDILLGSAAVVVTASLKDEKAAMAVIDEFTGADQPKGSTEIRLQRYGEHILRVIESRNRWKEGVSFAYGSAGKTFVAGTSLPLVAATIDRLDGQGKGLADNQAMVEVRRSVTGASLGHAFLWVDLVELSQSISASADRFAQQRADRVIDRARLRADLEESEGRRLRPPRAGRLREEFDARVTKLFEEKVASAKQGYVQEIKDTAAALAKYGTAGLSIEGKADSVKIRGAVRLKSP